MKSASVAQIGFGVFACASVFAFMSMARDAETRRACVPICAMRPAYAGRNRIAPDFELSTPEGTKVHLSEFRGKTVVLNFWTTTCQPCLEEMPSLADLAKVLKDRSDVVVLTISTDANQETAMSALRTLLHEAKPPFRVLLDPESTVVNEKYGTSLFPETWIIDPTGVIRARFDGARDWSNAMVIDLIDSLKSPLACGVNFESGRPSGAEASVCEEAGAS